MRVFFKVSTLIWAIIWVVIGIGVFLETPEQIKSDDAFFKKEIEPSVDFVESFKLKNNRLPNYREFYTWARDYYKDYSSDLSQAIDSSIGKEAFLHKYIRCDGDVYEEKDLSNFKDANWATDYAIGAWRGDWAEYYYSWNKEYDGNNYTRKSGLFTLLLMTTIGIIPLLILWLYNIHKRKKQNV